MNESEIQLTSEITVRLIQKMGGDHMTVASAKVSVDGEEALKFADPSLAEENSKLIHFLAAMHHGTPFEHSAATFFVHAPIFVFREWHRHRIGFSYNEESARYRPLRPLFWIPRRDRPMIPVQGWKPGRPKFMTLDEAETLVHPNENPQIRLINADFQYSQEIERDRRAYNVTYQMYQESINQGIALEVARCKLPVGIYSSCWVTCNPRSIMSFLELRTYDERANHPSYPQMEIQEAARIVEEFYKQGWPISYAAWNKNGREAP